MSLNFYAARITDGIQEPVWDLWDDHVVNMAYGNAAPVLDVLGIERPRGEELAGTFDADDLLGRVLIARGLSPADPGRPALEEGVWLDMGRSEGYVDRRLTDLQSLAELARERGHLVAWD